MCGNFLHDDPLTHTHESGSVVVGKELLQQKKKMMS